MLDLLATLVDKNLVVFEEDDNGQGRYRLLETVRQYGRDRLLESGEGEALRRRHQDHFLRFAEEAAPRLREANSAVWFQKLETEHDNLRAALEWCLAPQNNLKNDAAAGLRFSEALRYFWDLGGFLREARRYLTNALARAASLGRTKERAIALRRCGVFAAHQGDYDAARLLFQEALTIWKEWNDAQGVAYALRSLAMVASSQRDYNRARTLLEESRTLLQESGERYELAESLHELGILAEYEGDYPQARSLYEPALGLFRELGNHHRVAWALHGLGFLALCEQDFTQARALLKDSLGMFCEGEVGWGKLRSLDRFANLAMAQGQVMRATHLLGAADTARAAIGYPQPLSEREEHDRILTAVHSALDGETFGVAWAEDQAMTQEQAIAYALDEELARD